jgi:NADH dehydrogenase
VPPLTRPGRSLIHRQCRAPAPADLADLGIAPTAAEVILPTYLDRFRVGGRYNKHAPA